MARTLLKILLIEDDPDHADFVKLSLSDTDRTTFELEHADCLAAGIDRLGKGDYDVILLDLGLPDACGYEALSQIRDARPDISVVVTTANSDPSVGIEAASWGAEDYLYKGDLNARTLERVLRQAVQRQEVILQLKSENRLLVQKNSEQQAEQENLQPSSGELEELTYVACRDLQQRVRELTSHSQLLREDVGKALPRRAEEDLASILRAATQMSVVIENLLSDRQPRQPTPGGSDERPQPNPSLDGLS